MDPQTAISLITVIISATIAFLFGMLVEKWALNKRMPKNPYGLIEQSMVSAIMSGYADMFEGIGKNLIDMAVSIRNSDLVRGKKQQ